MFPQNKDTKMLEFFLFVMYIFMAFGVFFIWEYFYMLKRDR